jgi:hypothetical protein
LQGLCFASIEPEEFANFTDFNLDSPTAIDRDFDHRVVARRAGPGPASLVVDGVEPQRIDRFFGEGATQQLQTHRTAIAFFATPDDAAAGADFGQWNTASGTKKFHRGNL